MNRQSHRSALRAIAVAGVTVGSLSAGVAAAGVASATSGPKIAFTNGVLTITGTAADDQLVVGSDATGVITLNGTPLSVKGVQPTISNVQRIEIDGHAGDDTISVNGVGGAVPSIDLTGGAGDDHITGSNAVDTLAGGSGDDTLVGLGGADTLLAGAGDDVIIGGQGNDVIKGGAGDDELVWNPGDASDTVRGGRGHDTLVFNGANIAETFDLSANGTGGATLFRNVGNVTMDVAKVEDVQIKAQGASDLATVHDLAGSGVQTVHIADGNGADLAADTVVVDGTDAAENITARPGAEGGVEIGGLAATVTVAATDGPLDTVQVNALGGDDVVDAGGLPAGFVTFSADGGAGNDLLVGSAGDDVLLGGLGDDVLEGGPGSDQLDGGPGSNVVIQ